MLINILGSSYSLEFVNADSDDLMKKRDVDGYTDRSSKRIVISNMTESGFDNVAEIKKQVIRHEIIHAFLNESGLADNWEHKPMGHEETMIDWLSIQFPRIMEAFKAADAL